MRRAFLRLVSFCMIVGLVGLLTGCDKLTPKKSTETEPAPSKSSN